MMWANYRRAASISVPSPYDGDATIPWWYDKISNLANGWAVNGITDVLFPSPLKTNAGAFPGADGYGPFDDMDIGSKNTSQFGGQATRFGIDEQLRRAIAICHANGLNVMIDHVMHQRMGGHNGVYNYLGADGKTLNGRFAKTPSCFMGSPPRVPRDPIPDVPDDFSFGDELCPINAIPLHYVRDGLIAAGNWLFTTLDADGARLDDMKGINSPFIEKFVTSGAMKGKWFFGEYASGNRNDTDWWVGQVHGTCSAADFDFHYNMAQDMCNEAGGGNFQMSWLKGRGMIGTMPMKAVPFVESMDSDTNGFATIVNNKILGYALMLGGEGLPMIYVRDYLQEPDCYGLKANIDNLIWIHQNLASGHTIDRYGDAKTYVFERDAGPGLIVALNNSVWDPSWIYVNVQTGFGSNVQLHDYTGHNANDCWTDTFGRVTLAIPPGANGLGYSCWSRAGVNHGNPVVGRSTTQVFYGAVDLDIGPAINAVKRVGRIWVAKDSPLEVMLTPDETDWTAVSTIGWQIWDPNDTVIGGATIEDVPIPSSTGASLTAHMEGWYTLYTTGSGLPVAGSPFALSVTYTAPQHFTLPTVLHTAEIALPDAKMAEEMATMSAHVASLRRQRNMRLSAKT
jgi:alpha-amylase